MAEPDLEAGRAPQPRGRRAARVLTIVGALALIVLVSVLIGGMLSMRHVLGTGVRKLTAAVMQDLPDGLSEPRREEVRRRLDCVGELAEAGRLDPRRLGEFSRMCKSAVARGRLDAPELREIETHAIALCVSGGGGIR